MHYLAFFALYCKYDIADGLWLLIGFVFQWNAT